MPAPTRSDPEARKQRRLGSPGQRAERLTSREVQILQMTADAVPSEEIAERLGISRHTLRTHMQNALMKLGVHSKLEAITLAIRTGKVRLEPLPEDPAD
jgi:DNA-binding CsgD family transcriptional regulator